MQKLWPELPDSDLDQAANDPAPELEPEAPPELPQAAATTSGSEPPNPPPTDIDEDDDYVPFFLTRGRWLRHIGLGKGAELVREVRYTTVEAYAHHPAPKGFTP